MIDQAHLRQATSPALSQVDVMREIRAVQETLSRLLAQLATMLVKSSQVNARTVLPVNTVQEVLTSRPAQKATIARNSPISSHQMKLASKWVVSARTTHSASRALDDLKTAVMDRNKIVKVRLHAMHARSAKFAEQEAVCKKTALITTTAMAILLTQEASSVKWASMER